MATSNSVYRLHVVLVSLVKEDCENDRVEHIHYHIIVMGKVSCSARTLVIIYTQNMRAQKLTKSAGLCG